MKNINFKKFRQFHLLTFCNQWDESIPLDHALTDYLRNHKSIGSHDRRFIGDTAYNLVRWKGLLDYLLQKGPFSWERRLALWEILDWGKLPNNLPSWAVAGMSPWLFSQLEKSHGEKQALLICDRLNQPAPVTLRVNLLKTTREALLQKLQHLEASPSSGVPTAIHLSKRVPLTHLPEFLEGLFEIQDEGSQRIADLVEAKPGDQILDYCSGSGGKSLSIAPKLQGQGQIYLHDVRPSVLIKAKRRLRRAGVQNCQCIPPEHPQLKSLQGKMDWVLADVPCSGSGTFRRNPDLKWKIDAKSLAALTALQRSIFSQSLTYVRPHGMIVYATCSLLSQENQDQVEFFLNNFPLRLAQEPLVLFPTTHGSDGFFAAQFQLINKPLA